MIKVAKFGGSSLASAEQIKKVANIIKNDPDIRGVVLSAPGKRNDSDTKVTDLLIKLFKEYSNSSDSYINTMDKIIERYRQIAYVLGLASDFIETYKIELNQMLQDIDDDLYLENALKSCGEDFNARLVARYLNSLGLKSRYVSPKEAGIELDYVLNEPVISDRTYENIKKLRDIDELIVMPGFYGVNKQGKILTFLRGGSDISGAILSRGLGCDIYENYTDMSYIYSAHPKMIESPKPIRNITYAEIRELSYNGFEIFQEDAVEPLLNQNIKICVKNTNKPYEGGTIIEQDRSDVGLNPVVGISNVGKFISFNITEYLMNRKVGYINKLLDIFEYQHIPVEHIPTGIDSLSILIRKEHIKSESEMQSLKNAIDDNFAYNKFNIKDNLASIAIVGEGLTNDMTRALYLISKSLNEENIKIEFIIQGASNNSLFLFVDEKDEKLATEKLYSYFM